jgi:glycosyltransferase involved in cell wall biosynthesis
MAPAPPRVSVIIPCFNLGWCLPDAIQSIRAQTHTDYEIIVIDDGSTEDETKKTLSDVASQGITVVASPNRGLSAARNLGIRHARGGYVCSVDADDLVEPTWLERGVAWLDADPGIAFVSHWLQAFGDEEWTWTPTRCDLAMLLDMNTVNGAALFRRSLVDAVGGFDESMRDGCEDWEFWIRVTAAGYRGAIVPEVQYRYRRRAGSMSRLMHEDGRWFELYAALMDKHQDLFRTHFLDLLLRREATIARLYRGIDGVQQELAGLDQAVEERRRERDRARLRLLEADTLPRADIQRERDGARAALDALRDELSVLRADRDEARSELNRVHRDLPGLVAERDASRARGEALEGSLSWRVTQPLRRIYEWLGLAGRPPGSTSS